MKETTTEIEEYLGIVDNPDPMYRELTVRNYKELKQKYSGDVKVDFALTEDLGLYIPYEKVIETCGNVSAFV